MRNSSLLKWAQNNKNGGKLTNGKGSSSPNGKEEKKWIHAPETLQQGHVVYLVKFLGCTEVDQPKGIDVVKQGIQKLKFNQQLTKKTESGGKTPKAELTISVEGVAIQEPKTKKMLHQYPLHKISYCADDKAEKRFFSFIAKEDEEGEVKHTCFVFVSDKLAEEITLTIGQAFELAYKKFLDTNTKELETKKSMLTLQKRVALLERENGILKTRLRDVASIKGQQDVQEYMHRNDISGDICDVSVSGPSQSASSTEASPSNTLNSNTPPPRAAHAAKAEQKPDELICLEATATKLDGFTLDDLDDDDFNPRGMDNNSDSDSDDNEFNPRAALPPQKPAPQVARAAPAVPLPTSASAVLLAPPPALPPREKNSSAPQMPAAPTQDMFSSPAAADPFASQNPFGDNDPFGMSSFEAKGVVAPVFQTAGIPAAATFSLDELDPLKK